MHGQLVIYEVEKCDGSSGTDWIVAFTNIRTPEQLLFSRLLKKKLT